MKINFSKIKTNIQKFLHNLSKEDSIEPSYTQKTSPLICQNCGGIFNREDLTDGDEIVTCIYCNTTYSADDIFRRSEKERLEEIRVNSHKAIEKEKHQLQHDIELEKIKSSVEREKEENRQNNKLLLGLAVFMIIIFLMCFVMSIVEKNSEEKNSEPNLIQIEVSAEDLQGQYYEDIVDMLTNKGFTDITAREDGWNIFKKEGTIKSISIDGNEDFSSGKFSKDAKIVILYYK